MDGGPFPERDEASIAQLQVAMSDGRLTAQALVEMFLARIKALDQNGPQLHAILEVNPEAQDIAAELDRERQAGRVRGPLHGIPILLKDNIDTADRLMTPPVMSMRMPAINCEEWRDQWLRFGRRSRRGRVRTGSPSG